jgi:peptidyl-prolyl cis-trans isomerase C
MSLNRLVPLILACSVVSACGDREVVARVGSHKVTRSDVDEFRRVRGEGALAPEKALDALVARERLAEAARQAGLSDDAQVRVRLRSAEREVLAQAFLDRELSKVTEEQVVERFKAKPDAYSVRRIHLAQIFFAAAPADGPRGLEAAQSRANAAWAKLLGGADFSELAQASSEDAATKAKGGDLGWIREGEIDPKLFEAVASLEANAWTKPLQTPFGFHVFRVLEPLETVPASFDAVKGRIQAQVRGEAEAQVLERVEKDVAVVLHRERLSEKESGQ